jgi:hypothetical protein
MVKCLIFLFALIIFNCCIKKNTNQDKYITDIAITDSSLFLSDSLINKKTGLSLFKFKQSSCESLDTINDSGDDDHITKFTKIFKNDTLIIIAKQQANCEVKYKGEIKYKNDTLFMILMYQGVIINKNRIDTIHSPAPCLCKYNFTFYICGISNQPKFYKTEIRFHKE